MEILKNASTDVTTYFVLRDSTNHAPKTDVTITDIDLYYVEQGAAISAKTDATALAAADSAHADGKGFHVGNGLYRIDWEDAAFDGGVGKKVILIVVCTGVDTTFLEVLLSPGVNTASIGGTAQTGRDLGASVLLSSGTGAGQISLSNGLVATADTQKVDVNTVKGRAAGDVGAGNTAHLLQSADAGATAVARPGNQMDLVNAPNATALAAIGAKVEAMVLDEGDATALLAAIAAKVEEFLINEGDATATIAAIATAVWANATRSLTDKAGFSLGTTPPTAGQIVTAFLTELLASDNFNTASSLGKLIKDNLDATITSRHAAGAAVAKSPATLNLAADAAGALPAGAFANQPAATVAGQDIANALKLAPAAGAAADNSVYDLLGHAINPADPTVTMNQIKIIHVSVTMRRV